MTETSYEFTRAITRAPCRAITNGLRAQDIGAPDLEQMQKDHAHYIEILRETGARIIELPALNDFPDSVLWKTRHFVCQKGRY